MDEFYRDVAVLAFPTPAAGASIADIDEKALYVRAPYSSQPGVKPFLPVAGRSIPPSPPARPSIPRASSTSRTSSRPTAGSPGTCRPAAGRSCASAARATGANTRPAPVPGLGLECDKLDKAALRRPFRRLRRGAPPRDRPAPDRRPGGLDDAPHRQLGDGRAELDRGLPRGIPAPPRLRPAALSCRR